jgi:hypothetical protein
MGICAGGDDERKIPPELDYSGGIFSASRPVLLLGDERSRGWPEVEEVEQVVQCRGVHWCVGARELHRVREVVAAATCHRRQVPIALDEFEDRDMVGVLVGDISPGMQGQEK